MKNLRVVVGKRNAELQKAKETRDAQTAEICMKEMDLTLEFYNKCIIRYKDLLPKYGILWNQHENLANEIEDLQDESDDIREKSDELSNANHEPLRGMTSY